MAQKESTPDKLKLQAYRIYVNQHAGKVKREAKKRKMSESAYVRAAIDAFQ